MVASQRMRHDSPSVRALPQQGSGALFDEGIAPLGTGGAVSNSLAFPSLGAVRQASNRHCALPPLQVTLRPLVEQLTPCPYQRRGLSLVRASLLRTAR